MRDQLRTVIRILLVVTLVAGIALGAYCLWPVADREIDDISAGVYYDSFAKEAMVITREQFISGIEEQDSKYLAPENRSSMNGWLHIPGTSIDYPVMQEEEGREGYYLKHRPDGVRSSSGSLYIPEGDTISSDNVIIYGHHMRNGTMFGSLKRYKDRLWALDHRDIELITPDGIKRYKVAAVIVQSTGSRRLFWEDYIDLTERERGEEYLNKALRLSLVDLPQIDTEDTEQPRFLTLVTCDYTVSNGRLVIVAVG